MQSLEPQSIEKIDASRNALPDVTRDVTTVTYEEYSNKLFAMQKTVPHQSGYLLKITAIGSDFRWCLAQELLFTGAIIGMPLRKHKFFAYLWDKCALYSKERWWRPSSRQEFFNALSRGLFWDVKGHGPYHILHVVSRVSPSLLPRPLAWSKAQDEKMHQALP